MSIYTRIGTKTHAHRSEMLGRIPKKSVYIYTEGQKEKQNQRTNAVVASKASAAKGASDRQIVASSIRACTKVIHISANRA